MMLGQNGQKLSKRHGAVSVAEYRDRGILPEALLNYLARFGWSFGDEEVFTMAQLRERFDWARCGRADGRFDEKKLNAVSFEHLKRMDFTSDEQYAAAVAPFLRARGIETLDESLLRASIRVVRERGQTLVDAADRLDFLFRTEPEFDEKARAKFLRPEAAPRLVELRERLAAAPAFVTAALETMVAAWVESLGIKLGEVAQPARVALTGRSASPGLFDIMELLGKDRTLARLDRAIQMATTA
jgi:glutamyl-tRNA synthetase